MVAILSQSQYVNPSVITVPADVLALYGARPSAGMLITAYT